MTFAGILLLLSAICFALVTFKVVIGGLLLLPLGLLLLALGLLVERTTFNRHV